MGMGAMAEAIDRDLVGVVESAAEGDEIAFGRIVAAYHAEMLRICVVITRDQALAEEAVQSAWAIAWRKLGSVREAARLRPWLISVAVNEARQLLRKRHRRAAVQTTVDASLQPGGSTPPPASATSICNTPWSILIPTTGRFWPCATSPVSTHRSSRRPSASARPAHAPASSASSTDYDRNSSDT